MMRVFVAILLAAAGATGQMPTLSVPKDALAPQGGPRNLDFESGKAGEVPPEWSLAQESRLAGYSAEIRKHGCHGGTGCAIIVAGPNVERSNSGILIQSFDAAGYRGKTLLLRAWLRLDGAQHGNRVRLAMSFDGEKKHAEYVPKTDVRSAEWTLAELKGKIPNDATDVHIAIILNGNGIAWVDDVTLEVAR